MSPKFKIIGGVGDNEVEVEPKNLWVTVAIFLLNWFTAYCIVILYTLHRHIFLGKYRAFT